VGLPPLVRLELPEAMRRALDAAGPPDRRIAAMKDFAPSLVADYALHPGTGEAPFAVVADLDGDRRLDVMLLERAGRGKARLVAITDPAGQPHAEVLASDLAAHREYGMAYVRLRHVAPGPFVLRDQDGTRTLQLPHGGVLVDLDEKSRVLYFRYEDRFLSASLPRP
jgi:hypothetical protein